MASIQHSECTVSPNGYQSHDESVERSFYSKYAHQRRLPPRTIRLICPAASPACSPGLSERVLKCYSIEEKSLDEPALSYVWGSEQATTPLILADEEINRVLLVTHNAWEAVHTLCITSPLWVDQICINQEDDDEKADQIGLMADIYRRCSKCTIWLGSADEHTRAGFNFVNELTGPKGTIPMSDPFPLLPRDVMPTTHSKIREMFQEKGLVGKLPAETHPGWTSFANCLCRPWFSRLWTFQEAVLPQRDSVVVCCGQFTTSIIALTRAAYLLGEEHIFGPEHSVRRGQLLLIDLWAARVETHLARPLAMLLDTLGLYDCTKPQDRIYALLGVQAEDVAMDPVIVNPKQPTKELYIDVTKNIINARSSLLICAHAPGRVGGQVDGLPSWVADWTAKATNRPFEYYDPKTFYFKADKGRKHVIPVTSNDWNLLAMGGIMDTVTKVVQSGIPENIDNQGRRDYLIGDLFPQLLEILESDAQNSSPSTRLHMIVKTITLDGYTRQSGTGQLGLEESAWNEERVLEMLEEAFAITRGHSRSDKQHDLNLWLHALAVQSFVLYGRRFATFENHRLGLVPGDSRAGDLVVILHGLSIPLILRREDEDKYRMMGPCFVDGIMYGEATTWEQSEATSFCIC